MPGPLIPPAAPAASPPEPFDGETIGLAIVAEVRHFCDRKLAPIAARLAAVEGMIAGMSKDALPRDDTP